MNIIKPVQVRCPYCGFISQFSTRELAEGMEIITCDLDEGGCDEPFVLDVEIEINISVRKIEGVGHGRE